MGKVVVARHRFADEMRLFYDVVLFNRAEHMVTTDFIDIGSARPTAYHAKAMTEWMAAEAKAAVSTNLNSYEVVTARFLDEKAADADAHQHD